jgi:hypothetical protein
LGVYVVDYESAVGIFEVTGNEAFKSLLSSSIPQLQAVSFILKDNIFDKEIDSDSGLDKCKGTL